MAAILWFSLLTLLALLGHVFLWAGLINRLHGLGLPRRLVKSFMPCIAVALIAIPILVVLPWLVQGAPGPRLSGAGLENPGTLYLVVCWCVAILTLAEVTWRWHLHRPPAVLRHHRTNLLDLARGRETDRPEEEHHFLVHMPGNESLLLDVAERALELERLPTALEGLSVLHLSDLHFTGRIGKSYFQEVVRLANEQTPDLVAITGDLVDFDECIDWIPDTFGQLQSRYGTYFVLGNHDLRVDVPRLRRVMVEAGLVDLGNRWQEVPVRDTSLLLIGNEMPWIGPAPELASAPPPAPDGPVRIVLAHTPDQIGWARRQQADLLLAGHLHGGQIRLPLLGPLLSPSLWGVRYARVGVHHLPPTVLHVTRGVSGIQPIRLNCPPEIVRLVLHGPSPLPRAGEGGEERAG